MADPSKPVDLSPEARGAWQARVTLAREERATLLRTWRDLVAAYAGEASPDDKADTLRVNKDWPRVRQKVSSLFFRVPEVQLRPRDERGKQNATLTASALNFYLQHRVNAFDMTQEVVTDVLAASGVGAAVIGYECVYQDAQQTVLPQDQQPNVLTDLMGEAGVLPQEPTPVILHEQFFGRRISPAALLWPVEFAGADWDRASWIGYEFEIPKEEAKKRFGLSDLETQALKTVSVERLSGEQDRRASLDLVRGCEIWYWARLFDPSVLHPKQMRKLVLLDGVDRAVEHRESPYQYTDEQGKLRGLEIFPIRVLTLGVKPDAAIPPSDTAIARPQVKELQVSREQMLEQREHSRPMRWADTNMIDPEQKQRLEDGTWQGILFTKGPGTNAIGEIARASYPPENFRFDEILNRDIDEAWAMGSPHMGLSTKGETTAAEVNTMNSAITNRLDYERALVLRWFTGCAQVLLSLMQQFCDAEDYVEVLGEDGARRLQGWNRLSIAGEYLFDIRPDAAQRIDAQADREQALNLFNMLAQHPLVNSRKLLEEVLRVHNLDPQNLLVQPPPSKPEAPNLSFRFGGEDLSPLNPAAPLVLALLEMGGLQIDPQILASAFERAKQLAMSGVLDASGKVNALPPGLELATAGRNLPGEQPLGGGNPQHSGGTPPQAAVISRHQAAGKGYQ